MADSSKPRRVTLAWRKTLGGLAVFALFAGMLFWTKLRLVSDIPRTAYAVPPEERDGRDGASENEAGGDQPTPKPGDEESDDQPEDGSD